MSKLNAAGTGHVDLADVGPRIKALRRQIEETEEGKHEILAQEAAPFQISGAEVRRCIEDLRELLADGTIMERKSWLRTWIKRVTIEKKRGGSIEYSLPLAILKRDGYSSGGLSKMGVLSTEQIGCPSHAIERTFRVHFSLPLSTRKAFLSRPRGSEQP